MTCGVKFETLVVGDRVPICPNCGEAENLQRLVSTFAMSIAESRNFRGSAANMFKNFTVQHVKDKRTGKPLVVNSLKELRAAEKEHHFALAIASDNNAAAAGPPQNESWAGDIAHDYNWKWAKDPHRRTDRAGISVGSGKLDARKKVVA